MRQYTPGDPIRVQTTGNGEPVAFRWHGQAHSITSIEDVREPRLDWWAATGEIHRRYFLVTTQQGLICEIFHDLSADSWALARLLD